MSKFSMRASWSALPFHPFLFALYPVLSLLAHNIFDVPFSDATRSIVFVLIFATALLLLFRPAVRDWTKAAALASLALVLFFSYGHIYELIKPVSFAGMPIARHRFLIPLWLAIFALVTWVVTAHARDLHFTTQLLNVVSLGTLILPVFVLVQYAVQTRLFSSQRQVEVNQGLLELPVNESTNKPDIYYIVLDSYARDDILQSRFGYDNSAFMDYLSSKGFYIARESNANYLWTSISLASSLNLDYLPNLDIYLGPGDYRENFHEAISTSVVRQELERLGYSIVSMPSGYMPSEIYDATYFLLPERNSLERLRTHWAFNAFEGMLFHYSAGLVVLDLDSLINTRAGSFIAQRVNYPRDIQREYILSAFENLQQAPEIVSQKFVFVHIVSPHSPYFFGPNGEDVTDNYPMSFTLPNTERTSTSFITPYLDQLTYINRLAEETIDAILDQSKEPPIILLQSDHGTSHGFDWENPDAEGLLARMSILNAYYLPEACQRELYPSISPVNSFRVVFNCIFNAHQPLLDDQTYFNNINSVGRYDFVDVRDMLPQGATNAQ